MTMRTRRRTLDDDRARRRRQADGALRSRRPARRMRADGMAHARARAIDDTATPERRFAFRCPDRNSMPPAIKLRRWDEIRKRPRGDPAAPDDAVRARARSGRIAAGCVDRVRRDAGRDRDEPRRAVAAEARPRRCARQSQAARSWLAWAHDYGIGRHTLGVALFAGVATLVDRRHRRDRDLHRQLLHRRASASGSPTTCASASTSTCTGSRSRFYDTRARPAR